MLEQYITPRGQADLDELWGYIASDNPAAADEVLARIMHTFDLLAENPEMGRARPEPNQDVRTFSVGKYIIAYRSSRQILEVLRVVHGARDVNSQL